MWKRRMRSLYGTPNSERDLRASGNGSVVRVQGGRKQNFNKNKEVERCLY